MFPIKVENLSYAYGARQALVDVTFSISQGEVFGFLGPNGSGKTTLFKILSTLIPVDQAAVNILGHELGNGVQRVRQYLGVVFQRPSLDLKLTVTENLRHQGHLYGLQGKPLKQRIQEALDQFELTDRAHEGVETLSGGLQRRAELAKATLHHPKVLLLDEPSTGLDPGARRSLRAYLNGLRNTTVVLTTHILEDAEACDRVAILNAGELVAIGTPDELKDQVSGDIVIVDSPEPEQLAPKINQRFGYATASIEGLLRIECHNGHEFVRDVVAAFPTEIQSVRLGKPTLEDVFIKLTGRRFEENGSSQDSVGLESSRTETH
ncbi:ABC transporter ATP-binding protein [Candidatus Poribacteria bacterium]|nr:MAG: ABC transporter ATP-binding protein [Candidatus Poribacteria bacterium]